MPGQDSRDVEMGKKRPAKPYQARQRGRSTAMLVRIGVLLPASLALTWAMWGRGAAGGDNRSSSSSSTQRSSTSEAAGTQQEGSRQRAAQQTDSRSAPAADGASGTTSASSGTPPELFTYRIVREYPHDAEAFTQGLQFDRACSGDGSNCTDVLWESTGMNGRSTVREVELESGRVLRRARLPQRDFGEGLTRHGDRLYQVTWQSPRTWTYAVHNFSDARLVQTPLRDGWGITSNGEHLVVGDSSERLFFLDPATLQTVRTIQVTDGGEEVRWLNELEWVDGQILANIWLTECIARVDPGTGAVSGWVTLKGIKSKMLSGLQKHVHTDVLNGIAWDGKGRRLFVTGKLWPKLYQVELVPLETSDPQAALQQLRQECVPKDTSLLG